MADLPDKTEVKAYCSLTRTQAALYQQAVKELAAELDSKSIEGADAIKRKADFAYAYFWRGQAYYGKKKADRMVSDFETFLKLAPKSPEAPIVRQLLSSLG